MAPIHISSTENKVRLKKGNAPCPRRPRNSREIPPRRCSAAQNAPSYHQRSSFAREGHEGIEPARRRARRLDAVACASGGEGDGLGCAKGVYRGVRMCGVTGKKRWRRAVERRVRSDIHRWRGRRVPVLMPTLPTPAPGRRRLVPPVSVEREGRRRRRRRRRRAVVLARRSGMASSGRPTLGPSRAVSARRVRTPAARKRSARAGGGDGARTGTSLTRKGKMRGKEWAGDGAGRVVGHRVEGGEGEGEECGEQSGLTSRRPIPACVKATRNFFVACVWRVCDSVVFSQCMNEP
ncbi:hypothetical protein FB451DRAFT_1498419, partial [Mycena latifolia]